MMVLFSHNIINEAVIARLLGLPIWLTLLQRILLSFLVVLAATTLAVKIGIPSPVVDFPDFTVSEAKPGWWPWMLGEVRQMGYILLAITTLVSSLRILELLRVMSVLLFLIRPLLRPLKLGDRASELTLIGLTLGLTYGAALLIEAKRKNELSQRELLTVIFFLNLCHSLVEDSLLVIGFGCSPLAALILRPLFALALTKIFLLLKGKIAED